MSENNIIDEEIIVGNPFSNNGIDIKRKYKPLYDYTGETYKNKLEFLSSQVDCLMKIARELMDDIEDIRGILKQVDSKTYINFYQTKKELT